VKFLDREDEGVYSLRGRGAFSFGTQFASLTIGILEEWNGGMLGSGLWLVEPQARRGNGVRLYWKIPLHTEVEILREWPDSHKRAESIWRV
jgi:hypothetical protein